MLLVLPPPNTTPLTTHFFFLMILLPPRSTLFPYTTLFRSRALHRRAGAGFHRALLPAHRALFRLVRVRGGCGDADARRLPEEEGRPVGAARGRAVLHVSGLHGAQASREPGRSRRGPGDSRVGLPQPAVSRAGAAARVPAQFPQPDPRRAD